MILSKKCPDCGIAITLDSSNRSTIDSFKLNKRLGRSCGKCAGSKQKDMIREKKIMDILKPKAFWRYNSVDKIFINKVIERNG